jgi:transcriptional regulator with XRE-family HTH domain
VPDVTASTTGRPRLREYRTQAGWTQQQLAEKLAYFAWTRGDKNAAVNTDMVAKWERGAKGISARYRTFLCQMFGVTPAQLGFTTDPATQAPPPAGPVRDSESLISMLDDATAILDQLGAAGTALAPQMLTAWRETVTSRRTMLGLLDQAATDPAGRARAATASIEDLEQLAERYAALYETANPRALLTSAAAHVQAVTEALRRDHTPDDRRRLLRNLAQVATLAGRLAYEDLGDAPSGRAHYSQAVDAAREANDHQAAALALGHAAQLAQAEGMTGAALAHLAAAHVHADQAPAVTPRLALIEAVMHTQPGEYTEPTAAEAAPTDVARGADRIGGRRSPKAARKSLTGLLDDLPAAARRARVMALVDLATVELRAGNHAEACRHATNAAALLAKMPYSAGTRRLRDFRATAVPALGTRVLRALDQYLAHVAA